MEMKKKISKKQSPNSKPVVQFVPLHDLKGKFSAREIALLHIVQTPEYAAFQKADIWMSNWFNKLRLKGIDPKKHIDYDALMKRFQNRIVLPLEAKQQELIKYYSK